MAHSLAETSKHIGANVESDLKYVSHISYLCNVNRWSSERHQVHLNVRVATEEDEVKRRKQSLETGNRLLTI